VTPDGRAISPRRPNANIDRLGDITWSEAERFRAQGITTIDRLWHAVGSDPYDGIRTVADLVRVPEGRLATLLADEARIMSAFVEPRRSLLGMAVAAWIVLLALRVLAPWLFGSWQVVTVKDVEPFEPVTPAGVARLLVARKPGSFGSVPDVLGRHVVTRVTAGTTLQAHHLLPPGLRKADVVGRHVVALRFADGAPGAALAPGDRVALALTPRADKGATPVLVEDVIALAVDRSRAPFLWTVALRGQDAAAAASAVTADVAVVRTVH
jgi:hypothetical protein